MRLTGDEGGEVRLQLELELELWPCRNRNPAVL